MTTQEILADLVHAYPKFFADLGQRWQDTMRLYVRHLSDVPPDVLAEVVNELINTEQWMPSLAKIRQVAAERMLRLPSESEALAQIEAVIDWARRVQGDVEAEGDQEQFPPVVHPLVSETLGHVGGFAGFRMAEDVTVVRGQFGRLYRDARARAVREWQVGQPELPPAEGRLQIASGDG